MAITTNNISLLDSAKEKINRYCRSEFGHDADFSNLTDIGVAYTTFDEYEDEVYDEEVEVQVSLNLIDYTVTKYVDGEARVVNKYEDLGALIEAELNYCSFEGFVYM